MSNKIKLTIQEIVDDFEHNNLEMMISKYLPNYKEKVPSEYFSEDISSYEKALILYKPLYENFKEIFYQLI